jgi:aminomuconate-semialdehyde/2-hydroxymuconate-6-semialdehyde dehydrogenase
MTSTAAAGKAAPLPLVPNFIAGVPATEGGERFPDVNPVTGRAHAQVCAATPAQLDAAVAAAQAALRGDWGRATTEQRCRLLHRIADGIERRFDEFLEAEIADTGKPAALARALDIPRGAANFRAFADFMRAQPVETWRQDTDDGRGALNYAVRHPVGVVGVICPWNLPLLLMTWKVAPALACGNAVIAKPSEETPGTAALLAEVIHAAGAPPGVFSVLNGFGPGAVGEWMTTHPGIRAITFTGESATGARIMKNAAAHIKPLSFELGGKNAAIVFADADFDRAVAGTARSTFLNCGQVCLCSERVYVERPIYERFVAALAREAGRLVPGRPHDPDTTLGPLISAVQRDKVLGCYALARSEGAEAVAGGGVPRFGDDRDGGFFIQPTVYTGVAQNSRTMQEEIFGPVCAVLPFDDEDEAVALANDSRYGLATALWTSDLTRAHRVAPRIETGVVWVNTWFLRDLRTPFGGMKLSGLGREGGRHSLDFYTEQSNICIKL